MARESSSSVSIPEFHRMLVLARWALGIFNDTRKTKLPFKMRPVMFDSPSEVQFLKDLDAYYHDPSNAAFFSEKDIYLLRNPAVKGRGIGFAQAGNFYPDFLLWMVDKKKDRQYLAFIDPKGLRIESVNIRLTINC